MQFFCKLLTNPSSSSSSLMPLSLSLYRIKNSENQKIVKLKSLWVFFCSFLQPQPLKTSCDWWTVYAFSSVSDAETKDITGKSLAYIESIRDSSATATLALPIPQLGSLLFLLIIHISSLWFSYRWWFLLRSLFVFRSIVIRSWD